MRPTKRTGLTDAAVRNLGAESKPYKVADGGGLHLLVKPNGSKLWKLAYRFAGKQKTLALGAYPAVGIGEARKKREDAKAKLRDFLDPAQQRRIERAKAEQHAENTFKSVALRWLAARGKAWDQVYADRVRIRLEDHIYPDLGGVPIVDIEPPMLLKTIRKIESRGSVDLAKRIRGYCGNIFRFGIAEGVAVRDPSADISGALQPSPPVKHRAALKRVELPEFMRRLAAYDGDPRTALAIKLDMHTIVRTNELRFALWSEFEGLGGAEPLWRIPPERMKMPREHLVPLTPSVVNLLQELEPRPADRKGLLFPADTRSGVISENTMLYALYRLGYHKRATVHGFRGMASTILNEHGFNRDWIERQLAHVEQDDVRAAYNAAEWLPQRREMMRWWSEFLDHQADVADLVG